MQKVNVFHIGPQKSGRTWLFNALKEHQQVSSSKKDSIHYMDIFHHRGESWFHGHFQSWSEKVILDPTYSYLRDNDAPRKIYEYNPSAKIMLTARNPVDRAFSHYWHEKKKDRFNFKFEEVLGNYDLFANWIEPGFYARHYKNYLRYFPEENIRILFFDDLIESPSEFFKDVCAFCGIANTVVPSILNRKVNAAGMFKTRRQRVLEEKIKRYAVLNLGLLIKNKIMPTGHKEKLEDVNRCIKNELNDLYHEDICELETIAERDLSAWKKS